MIRTWGCSHGTARNVKILAPGVCGMFVRVESMELTTSPKGLLWASPDLFLILYHEVFVGGQSD